MEIIQPQSAGSCPALSFFLSIIYEKEHVTGFGYGNYKTLRNSIISLVSLFGLFISQPAYSSEWQCPTQLTVGRGTRQASEIFDIFKPYFKIAEDRDADRDSTLKLYADYGKCLQRTQAELAQSKAYYASLGVFSTKIIDYPSVLIQEALLQLYPRNVDDQNPKRASELINGALNAYTQVMADAQQLADIEQAKAQKEYAFAVAEEEERMRSARTNAIFSAVVGGYVYKKGGADSDEVAKAIQRPFDKLVHDREEALTQLKDLQLSIQAAPDLDVNASWSDDGTRLHIVRFGKNINRVAYSWEQDHTGSIVRLITPNSYCTGAKVSSNMVLTAQHCILDEHGISAPKPWKIRYEYLVHDRLNGVQVASEEANVVDVVTPEKRWSDSWNNDWAILRIDADVGYRTFAMPLSPEELKKVRVAVAGYSSDAEDGQYITMDWGCLAHSEAGLIRHRCKTFKGASGSPIVVAEGRYKGNVIGIHAFGGEGKPGGGPLINAEIYEAINGK